MENKSIASYKLEHSGIPLQIHIYSKTGAAVPYYHLSLLNITDDTRNIIEKTRHHIISGLHLAQKKVQDGEKEIKEIFAKKLAEVIKGQFQGVDDATLDMIKNYILITSLGLSEIEFLLKDDALEEIVINGADKPVWVYHKEHGWLKTNVVFHDENKIRHFATLIGRDVDKGITLLNPLLDAHLKGGDRVNATLSPITSQGNTITIRKFAKNPWTITHLLSNGTIDFSAAALLWQAMQYELSVLIVGGTGSGKTSFLNVASTFIPPNQRVISIEDTRELKLPKTLHWVPMQSRLPNPEGKGEISMLDCMVNTLRMRPDRILVGEVRRKEELEVMFEAMHTGHSVYSTFHASNVDEAIARLTNPPIGLPRQLLSSIGMIIVQHRNRRTGKRRTFQVAELDMMGTPYLIMQHDQMKDSMKQINPPQRLLNLLEMYTGMNNKAAYQEIQEKMMILRWLVNKKVLDINKLGLIMNDYYSQKDKLLALVRSNGDYE